MGNNYQKEYFTCNLPLCISISAREKNVKELAAQEACSWPMGSSWHLNCQEKEMLTKKNNGNRA
jgi:hypothetical protein